MTATPSTPEYEAAIASRDALVDRFFRAATEAMELYHVYLGDRLGLYVALAAMGDASPPELAMRTGVAERYAREWCEQQAVAGVLVADEEDDPTTRRYALPAGHAEVLLDPDSLSYMTPIAAGIVALARTLPAVSEAFQSGGGVPLATYGPDLRACVAGLNRPMFVNQLGTQWIPAMPDVAERLEGTPPARVADVGCGAGWSSIAFALLYPSVHVDGFDVDSDSVAEARENAAAAEVADRVTFSVRDVAEPGLAGEYDLVCAFDTLHELADPVGALTTMRRLRARGGTVLIGDEKAAEWFSAPGDENERLLYGWSTLRCLPISMTEPGSEATGAVMRPETVRRFAREAGFTEVEVLPVDHGLWRFYRLVG